MEHKTFQEHFKVVLYNNNLWLQGKRFFGQNYFNQYIRFTFADNLTFNIHQTTIDEKIINEMSDDDIITIDGQLVLQGSSFNCPLKVNTFFGNENENQFHSAKMLYPEIICLDGSQYYANIMKIDLSNTLYKKNIYNSELELILLNLKLYMIEKYLSTNIFINKKKLLYIEYGSNDEPEISINLCPNLNRQLNVDTNIKNKDDEYLDENKDEYLDENKDENLYDEDEDDEYVENILNHLVSIDDKLMIINKELIHYKILLNFYVCILFGLIIFAIL